MDLYSQLEEGKNNTQLQFKFLQVNLIQDFLKEKNPKKLSKIEHYTNQCEDSDINNESDSDSEDEDSY